VGHRVTLPRPVGCFQLPTALPPPAAGALLPPRNLSRALELTPPPPPQPPCPPHLTPPHPQAGVNVSVVYGSMPPEAYRAASGNPELMKRVKDSGDNRWGWGGFGKGGTGGWEGNPELMKRVKDSGTTVGGLILGAGKRACSHRFCDPPRPAPTFKPRCKPTLPPSTHRPAALPLS
jgi:hypothetical protein